MSANEARAEAARRYPRYDGNGLATYLAGERAAFERGAEWQASSREVSHDDKCEAEYVVGAAGYTDCGCAERRQASREVKPERLPATIRAALIDFAAWRIQAVWDDAGEVSAQVLAENIVPAQEFAWLSHQIPITAASREVTEAKVEAAARAMSDEGPTPRHPMWAEMDSVERRYWRGKARVALEAVAREVTE